MWAAVERSGREPAVSPCLSHTSGRVPGRPRHCAGPYVQPAGWVLNPRADLSFPRRIVIPERRPPDSEQRTGIQFFPGTTESTEATEKERILTKKAILVGTRPLL